MLYIRVETDTSVILGILVQIKRDKDSYSVTVGDTSVDCKDIIAYESEHYRQSWGPDSRMADPDGFERYCSIVNAIDFNFKEA